MIYCALEFATKVCRFIAYCPKMQYALGTQLYIAYCHAKYARRVTCQNCCMKQSSCSGLPSSSKSFLYNRLRMEVTACLLRMVKAAICLGGMPIFISRHTFSSMSDMG